MSRDGYVILAAILFIGLSSVYRSHQREDRLARVTAERKKRSRYSKLQRWELEALRKEDPGKRAAREAEEDRARRATARDDLRTLYDAVERYAKHHGAPPEMLHALTRPDDANGDRPYLDVLPRDPWGRPYQLVTSEGAQFVVMSLGADGLQGGEGFDADVRSDPMEGDHAPVIGG